jgi:uncharacterized protein YwqG
MASVFSRWFGKKPDDSPARDVAALAGPLAVPAVHVVKTAAPSRSHFGGSPNLPPQVAWPERNGTSLACLARLSLPEIHRAHPIEWLPRDGALLFFYDIDNQPWGFDPKDRGGWAVRLVPDLADAVSSAGSSSGLPHRNVAFRRIDVLPSFDRDAVERLALSSKESDRYADLSDAVFRTEPRHQIAGFPSPIQGDGMELESQLASHGVYCGDERFNTDSRVPSLTPDAVTWRLLLQFDSEDDLDVMWGDAGIIYYWVEADAARVGRFENAWLILQCH